MKNSKTFEGMLLGEGLKFGIVVARFNDFITNKMLEGAMDALLRHGVNEDDIEVTLVPGSFVPSGDPALAVASDTAPESMSQ